MARVRVVALDEVRRSRSRVRQEVERFKEALRDLPELHRQGQTKVFQLEPHEKLSTVRMRLRTAARELGLRIRVFRQNENELAVRLYE